MVMSIDPLKTNLTADEAGELLAQLTAGKTFSDGPYDYRVAVKNTDVINGLIITVTNDPDHIGPDLVKYVLTRLEVMVRNCKEANQLEFYIIKIWMDAWGHRINFQDEMEIDEDIDFTFADKDKADRVYKTIDFTEGRRRRQVNTKKAQKYIDHFNNSYGERHAYLKEVLHKNDKTYKMAKQILGIEPFMRFTCKATLFSDVTIEDGDMKTDFNIQISGWMDDDTCRWMQKLYEYTVGDDPVNVNANDSKSELRHAFRRVIHDMLFEKACAPIKDYFIHSPVHLDKIHISIRPKEGYLTFNSSFTHSY
jgi:hypothetical protein